MAGLLSALAQMMRTASACLGKQLPKADHAAASRICGAMANANAIHAYDVAGARRLALAVLWYAEAVIRNQIAAEVNS